MMYRMMVRGKASQRGYAESIRGLLSAQADKYTHRDLLLAPHQEVQFTYEEVQKHVDALGNGFHDLQCDAEGKMLFHVGNETEGVVGPLAALGAGLCPAFVGLKTPLAALRDIISDRIQVVVASGASSTKVSFSDFYEIFPSLRENQYGAPLSVAGAPDLKHVMHTEHERWVGMQILRNFLCYDVTPSPLVGVADDKVQCVTISDSNVRKAHSQKELLAFAASVNKELKITTSDRICNSTGLDSSLGYAAGVVSPMLEGAAVVLAGNQAGVKGVLQCADKTGCQVWLTTVPQAEAVLADESIDVQVARVGVLYSGEKPDLSGAIQQRLGSERVAFIDVGSC